MYAGDFNLKLYREIGGHNLSVRLHVVMGNYDKELSGNKLFEFIEKAAKFDVLAAFLHGNHATTQKMKDCATDAIRDVSDDIREILSKDREEFSIVSCDIDVVWQAFQELGDPPSEKDVQKVREAMQCIRDTIFFSEDGNIISLGFKFELGRVNFMKEYIELANS